MGRVDSHRTSYRTAAHTAAREALVVPGRADCASDQNKSIQDDEDCSGRVKMARETKIMIAGYPKSFVFGKDEAAAATPFGAGCGGVEQ